MQYPTEPRGFVINQSLNECHGHQVDLRRITDKRKI